MTLLGNLFAATTEIVAAKKYIPPIKDQTGSVFVALEVYSEKDPSDRLFHTFPVNPAALTIAQRYLQSITPTLSGVFVDEFGRAPSPVTLQGTFGMWVRNYIPDAISRHLVTPVRPASQLTSQRILDPESGTSRIVLGDPTYQQYSGYQLVKWLSFLVERSHQPDVNGFPRKARFYNFAFDEVYEVALSDITISMSVQSNQIWYYNLQMVALRMVDAKEKGVSDLRLVERDIYVVQDVRDVLSKAKKWFTKYKAIEEKIRDRSSKLFRLSPGDLLKYAEDFLDKELKLTPGTTFDVFRAITRLPGTIEAVANIGSQVTSRIPGDVIRDFVRARNAVDRALEAVSNLPRQWPFDTDGQRVDTSGRIPAAVGVGASGLLPASVRSQIPTTNAPLVEYAELITRSQTLLDGLELTALIGGSPLSSAVASDAAVATSDARDAAPVPLASSSVTQSYTIVQGDTLTSLAERYLGSADRWTQIASANQEALAALSTGFDFGPDEDLSLLVGEVLAVPVRTATVELARDPFVFDTPIGTRILGRDWPEQLRLRRRADGTADLEVLSPAETLVQGVDERLKTPLGAIDDVPEFGSALPLLVGENFGIFTERLATTAVSDALLKDGRIAGVRNVEVTRQGTGILVAIDALLTNGTTLGITDVTVTYE